MKILDVNMRLKTNKKNYIYYCRTVVNRYVQQY